MNLIEKLFILVRGWFTDIPRDVRVYATQALEVTSRIKGILTHPVADILLAIVPTDWDKIVRDGIVEALNEAVKHLAIVETCAAHTDTNEMLLCWVAELRKLPKHAQNAMLHKLASLLTALQHGKELKQSLYDTYTQITYVHSK